MGNRDRQRRNQRSRSNRRRPFGNSCIKIPLPFAVDAGDFVSGIAKLILAARHCSCPASLWAEL